MANILYIQHASELITVQGHSKSPAKKEGMSDLGIIKNGCVLVKDGKIIAVGTDEEIKQEHQVL